MPPHASDRNLLFAVLALQNQFVPHEELLAVIKASVPHRDEPLGQILEEKGRLSPQRRRLLDDLVAEHLQAHAGDVEQSLASLSPASA